jgi:hypothetical protein
MEMHREVLLFPLTFSLFFMLVLWFEPGASHIMIYHSATYQPFLILLETGPHLVVQAGFEFIILPLQSPE